MVLANCIAITTWVDTDGWTVDIVYFPYEMLFVILVTNPYTDNVAIMFVNFQWSLQKLQLRKLIPARCLSSLR